MTESPQSAIQAIRDALARATPGVWTIDDPELVWSATARAYVCVTEWGDPPLPNFPNNAAYIAACHPERIARVLEYVQALQSMIGDALGQSLRCPKDHDWRPAEMQAAQPRPECSEVAGLRERVQALEADAARYRLLRFDHEGEMLPDIALYSGRALDDYIDAALAAEPKGQG